MKKFFSLLAAFLLVTTPAYAYHTETQTPYGINISVDNETGEIELTFQESDALEVNPPEYYRLFFGDDDQAADFSIDTSFGFNEALSWRTYYFTPEYIYEKFETTTLTFYAKIQARNDTGSTVSDYTAVVSVEYDYDYVPDTTTSSSTTSSTTTTTTTLPKAEDVVEDGNTTYLAWDEYGCEHPNNPLSFKEYLEAVESGVWFGYQDGDCSDVPDIITIIIEEEEIEDELDQEILGDDTLGEEEIFIEEEELTQEEIDIIEAEIKAEEERLIAEQIDAEEELLILEELEDSVIILEDLSEEEIQEFVDVIQEIEDTIEIIEIVEEIIELDIPEDIILVIEEKVLEDDDVVVVEDEEVIQEVLDEPIQEDVEEKLAEELSEEEVIEELVEVEEVIEELITVEIVEVSEEELEEFTEEELVEYEEAKKEAIQEFVQELTNEEVVEVLEEVQDVGVQNLEQVSEEVQEVVQAVVEEAIDNVEELTEEQVEVVAEVLQVETEDVAIVAEAIKSDEVVAEAVEEYVERAVENADVEDYTLADVVTEKTYEAFLENPIEVFVDVDIQDINLSTIGNDMTQDQREKAQEVVVPVILTRIVSIAAFVMRKSL
jgi:hypothetical protein